MNEAQKQSLEAVRNFICEVTVHVAPGASPSNFASGIIICNETGKPFVLTAKHAVRDVPSWRPTTISVPRLAEELRDAVDDVVFAPDVRGRDVDVAVLVLSDGAVAKLAGVGAGINQLAPDSMLDVDAFSVLTGFPTGLMKPLSREANVITLGIAAVHYETEAQGLDDKGRIRVGWVQNMPGMEEFSTDFKASRRVNYTVESPGGISGAGFWKFPTPTKGEVWSPRSHGKLVGVAVAWNRIDTEFVESVVDFGDWLREVVAAR